MYVHLLVLCVERTGLMRQFFLCLEVYWWWALYFECQWPWVMCQLLSSQICAVQSSSEHCARGSVLTQSEKPGWMFSDVLGFSLWIFIFLLGY